MRSRPVQARFPASRKDRDNWSNITIGGFPTVTRELLWRQTYSHDLNFDSILTWTWPDVRCFRGLALVLSLLCTTWRRNLTSTEEVAMFQFPYPNSSWMMSGRTSSHQKLVPTFPVIDNCLMATEQDFLEMEASLWLNKKVDCLLYAVGKQLSHPWLILEENGLYNDDDDWSNAIDSPSNRSSKSFLHRHLYI